MLTKQNSRINLRPVHWRLDGWSIGSLVIGFVVLAPMLAVLWIAFHPTENIWPHLVATVLPRYFMTTLRLMLGVGVLTAAMGVGAAWLVTMYRFPGATIGSRRSARNGRRLWCWLRFYTPMSTC